MTNIDRFKFRFWHAEEKEMFYQENQYLSSFLQRIYVKYNITHPSYLDFEIEDRLMQCTRLKDKNDKLIYEGDIVKGAKMNCGVSNPDICEVEWDNSITGFIPLNLYDCDCDIYNYAEDMEIIGNIHENPELLKGRNE